MTFIAHVAQSKTPQHTLEVFTGSRLAQFTVQGTAAVPENSLRWGTERGDVEDAGKRAVADGVSRSDFVAADQAVGCAQQARSAAAPCSRRREAAGKSTGDCRRCSEHLAEGAVSNLVAREGLVGADARRCEVDRRGDSGNQRATGQPCKTSEGHKACKGSTTGDHRCGQNGLLDVSVFPLVFKEVAGGIGNAVADVFKEVSDAVEEVTGDRRVKRTHFGVTEEPEPGRIGGGVRVFEDVTNDVGVARVEAQAINNDSYDPVTSLRLRIPPQ